MRARFIVPHSDTLCLTVQDPGDHMGNYCACRSDVLTMQQDDMISNQCWKHHADELPHLNCAGSALQSGGGGNARGMDAAQCLEGLQSRLPQKAAAAGGNIVARAPPFDPARDLAIVPPNLALQPARLSTWARWRTVLRELLGRGRGASGQLSAILVRHSSRWTVGLS